MTKNRAQVDNRKSRLEARSAYLERKQTALSRDKDNVDKIVWVMALDKGWWKAFNRSAVYYAMLVAPRINKTIPQLVEDSDYEFPAENVVMTSNIGRIVKAAERLGMEVDERYDIGYVVIKLGQKVTREQYNNFLHEENELWTKAQGMILPAVIWPKVKDLLLRLSKILDEQVRKMPQDRKIEIGAKMQAEAREAVQTFILIARERVSKEEGAGMMMENLDRLDALMLIADYERLMPDVNKAMDIQLLAEDARTAIARELNKTIQEKAGAKK